MQTRFQNRVSMGLAVLGVFDTHHAVWSANAALGADRAALAELLQSIQTAASIQGSATSGVANGKNRKQVAMIEALLPIADDLHALADQTGDAVLAARSAVTFSSLANLADTAVGPRCQELLDLASAHAAALAASGATAADSCVASLHR